MEKDAPQNGYLFLPFFDVYQYPCVQCRLEPVNKHKNKNRKLSTVYPYGLSRARYSQMGD